MDTFLLGRRWPNRDPITYRLIVSIWCGKYVDEVSYIYIYECMYVYIYVCMYMYIYIHGCVYIIYIIINTRKEILMCMMLHVLYNLFTEKIKLICTESSEECLYVLMYAVLLLKFIQGIKKYTEKWNWSILSWLCRRLIKYLMSH